MAMQLYLTDCNKEKFKVYGNLKDQINFKF